jgi:UDP-N-acetylglucosamine acyltransferase
MAEISPWAAVDPKAQIGADVRIGPFCVVGPDVIIGPGSHLMNNVTVQGITRIGANNVFYPNVVVGVAPQDLKYRGAPTETLIGATNVFRECCTVHRGTELGGGRTVVGSHNLFMVGVHIAHDCFLADKIILGNQTQLAGHVRVEEGAVVSALVGLHHFVTVGKYSYIGGLTPVRRDVPPFVKFDGDPNEVRAVNEEGLKRNGFSAQEIDQIKQAFRQLYRQGGDILSNLERLEATGGLNGHVQYLCGFLRASCAGRFGRYQELARRDNREDRRRRDPLEVRERPDGKEGS